MSRVTAPLVQVLCLVVPLIVAALAPGETGTARALHYTATGIARSVLRRLWKGRTVFGHTRRIVGGTCQQLRMCSEPW